jgi:hypothetical protein
MKEPSEPPRRPLSLSGKKTFFPKGATKFPKGASRGKTFFLKGPRNFLKGPGSRPASSSCEGVGRYSECNPYGKVEKVRWGQAVAEKSRCSGPVVERAGAVQKLPLRFHLRSSHYHF